NITDVITKLRAENTNMSVLVVPYWEFASTSETAWESWRQEAKTRAAANSAAFLDLYNLIGSTDTDPYSYTSDGDELVDLGHSYIGLGLAQFVTAAPTSVTIAGTIPPVDTANFVKKNDDNTYDADKVQTHQATADTTDVVTVTGPGATANLSARALEVVEGAASVNITPTGFVATGSSGTVVFAVAATDKMTILDGTLSATEIVHADASASNESATLSQVDDAIDTAEATLDGRIAEPDTSDESSPVDGLVQVRTDLEQIQQYDGSTWHLLARKFVGAKIRRTTGISKAEGWNATNHTVTDWEEGIVRITTEGSGNTGQGVHIPTDYGGKFELSVRSEWAANNVGWRGIRIAVAPSDVGGTDYDLALVPSSGSTFQHRHSASVELELADDDFVYPEHYQNSGGVLTLGSVWFSIRRIGD
ncbi:MAG: hypothetical protein GY788_23745, partial [bacterium]|nr:hypothetical protein [bacterium]